MVDRVVLPIRRTASLVLAGAVLAAILALLAPASGHAAIITVGSPLSTPATLNTAENLGYTGTDTQVLPTREVPTGVVHTYHYGADDALWNTTVAGAQAAMPATGQAVKISIEGCAIPALGGPAPLTQFHLQDLSPLPGGGARVNLSSQPFDLPVCSSNGASGSTVTAYEPVNLCVSQGDYVAFNDEGGFVEKSYQSGVGYQVLGAVSGSAFASFIRGNGTGNGAVLSALDTTAMDGFSLNTQKELMLQVALATGPDATHICAGGTAGAPAVLPPITVHPQTDGINHSRVVSVAIYCRLTPGCRGTATLMLGGKGQGVGHAGFALRGNKTSHLPIRIAPQVVKLIRAHHGVATTLVAVVAGKTVTQTITVKIL
jgi:hypothetical protein